MQRAQATLRVQVPPTIQEYWKRSERQRLNIIHKQFNLVKVDYDA